MREKLQVMSALPMGTKEVAEDMGEAVDVKLLPISSEECSWEIDISVAVDSDESSPSITRWTLAQEPQFRQLRFREEVFFFWNEMYLPPVLGFRFQRVNMVLIAFMDGEELILCAQVWLCFVPAR